MLRLARKTWALLMAVLGLVGFLLLQLPEITNAVRTQVPIARCLWPVPMSASADSFNVLVTEFPVLDGAGRRVSSNDSAQIAGFVYDKLANYLARAYAEHDLDRRPEVRPPDVACAVEGNSEQERDANASEQARRTNADIVVYGVARQDGSRLHFSPEFYINPKFNDSRWYVGSREAAELAGPHSLGSALSLESPFEPQNYAGVENMPLAERAKAMSFIAIALSYYSNSNMKMAELYFQQASEMDGWPIMDTGKATIYLMLGNTLVQRASIEKAPNYLVKVNDY